MLQLHKHDGCRRQASIGIGFGSLLPKDMAVLACQDSSTLSKGNYEITFEVEGANILCNILIGGVMFTSDGFGTGSGVEWDRLMGGNKQTRLPYGARVNMRK